MAYHPLNLPDSLPKEIRGAIDGGAEPLLRNVHAMLRLPLPEVGLGAGCGFSITNNLLSIVSGASVLLYSHEGGSAALFKAFLTDFYPWDSEPARDGLCVGSQAADELYAEYRNPFAHALGISIRTVTPTTRVLERRPYQLKVKRWIVGDRDEGKHIGVTEAGIEELEAADRRRPSWLPATLTVQPHKKVTCPEALYWGTRKAIEAICRDDARMQRAEEFMERARIAAPPMTPPQTAPAAQDGIGRWTSSKRSSTS